METISQADGNKQDFLVSRNDSGWTEDRSLIEDYDAGVQYLAAEDGKTHFVFQWPNAQNNDTGLTPADHWENSGGSGTYHQAATPSNLLGRTFKQQARTSVADGCISPGTTTPMRNPLSVPNEGDNCDGIALSSRRVTPVQFVQPRQKGIATIGQVQSSINSETSTEDVSTTLRIEESQWHRGQPSRLLSYQSTSTSSSEDFGEALTSHPNPRSPESEESSDEYIMAEDQVIPSSISPSNSRKSFKFAKTKPKLRRQDRQSSSQRKSRDSFKSNISSLEDIRAAHPSRHYSYGATLDLPPIGIQTHRDSSNCKISANEACLDDTDLVLPSVLPPTLRELEAQLGAEDEPLSTFQKYLIGGLLVLGNVSLLGSSVFLLLWPKIWNESRFAIAAIPSTVWLCLILNVMQCRRRCRRAGSRLERSETAVGDGGYNERDDWPSQRLVSS